ncbi:MAG: DNA-binding protein [Alcaligenaceae bacterium]|nr:MAG: DNA-binding protein [Alcaligenaceae bacterium]
MTEFITSKEAAGLLRMTPEALAVARCRRLSHLPPAYRFGRRVLYKREDVLAAIKPAI